MLCTHPKSHCTQVGIKLSERLNLDRKPRQLHSPCGASCGSDNRRAGTLTLLLCSHFQSGIMLTVQLAADRDDTQKVWQHPCSCRSSSHISSSPCMAAAKGRFNMHRVRPQPPLVASTGARSARQSGSAASRPFAPTHHVRKRRPSLCSWCGGRQHLPPCRSIASRRAGADAHIVV